MSSNKQDLKTHSAEADSDRAASEDSQGLRDSMTNSDKADSKDKQDKAIHSAIFSRNSRNSSEDSRAEAEVAEEHKRR